MPSNLAAIRKLVSVAFSDEELTTFCFDHFRAVFEEFTAGQTKGQRVLSLVGFAERRGLLDALLDKVKKANPHQFALFEANLQADQGREAYTKLETKPFEPETMLIPGGPFLMGSPPGPGIPESETPQHTVDLPDYRIGRYPVTNWQYAEFVRREKTQDAPKEAGWFLREPPADRLDHPVTGVIWHDAVAYCRWLSAQTGRCYRLPSEAEWEKAASWVGVDKETSRQVDEGRKRRYPWGDAWDPACANAGSGGTTPVTAHPVGASPYGCEDMLGNVQEWTSTLWGSRREQPDYPYPYRADDGREVQEASALPSVVFRVHRGGSYRDRGEALRCSARGISAPEGKVPWRGFRVAMTV
jgi:formylglycine-generating enzyme required for sulfatase activity